LNNIIGLTVVLSGQGHFEFFKMGAPHFPLHILVAYLESFPKHYNKT